MEAPVALPGASPNLAQARVQVSELLGRLAQEVDAQRQDAGFQEALRTMSRFWRYSYLNQHFIRWQRPDATMVNSRLRWEAIGRKVKPGEVPIEILAPSRRGGVLRFVAVSVFDVRQTRGPKVATLDLQLKGGSRHVKILERAAAQLGVEVAWVVPSLEAKGMSFGGRIEVSPHLPGRDKVAVLAHELAHEILHQAERQRATELKRPGPDRSHAERETEADATAYVVLAALGLPSRAPSYIAWQGGTGQGVLRSMTRVQRAAKVILEAAQWQKELEAGRIPMSKREEPSHAPLSVGTTPTENWNRSKRLALWAQWRRQSVKSGPEYSGRRQDWRLPGVLEQN